MNKGTKSTAERRTQQPGDGVRAASVTHYIEKPPGPVHIPDVGQPTEQREHLYSMEGHLFWDGVDLTNLADSSSKWTQSGGPDSPIHRLGRVGIGTSQPSTELEVAGTLTASGLRLASLQGVAKFDGGRATGGAVLSDMADVSTDAAEPGHLLVLGESGWVAMSPRNAVVLDHSKLTGADADVHAQYLTAERHDEIPHAVRSLSVDGSLEASSSGVEIVAATVIRGELTLIGRSGVLIARRGRVSADATSDDIPEGETARFHTPERVAEVGDRRYLMLNGSNASSLRPGGSTIHDLDADSVDGRHATDFAIVDHAHQHSEIEGTGEDDHHQKVHRIDGGEHSVPPGATVGSVLVVQAGGGLAFSTIDVSSTSGIIPLSRIDVGGVKKQDLSALVGIRGSIQSQIDSRAEREHVHQHGDAPDLDIDQHAQYLTRDRADTWLQAKSTDDIRQGNRNRYVDPSEIVAIVDRQHVRIDGSNLTGGTIRGLDADLVDGVHASDLSRVGHAHDHSSTANIGRDDHHPEVHDLESHRVTRPVSAEAVLKVRDGRPCFDKLVASDLPFPVASSEEVSALAAKVGRHAIELSSRSDVSHGHAHSTLSGKEQDDHKQYLTSDRAMALVGGLSTDSIREGKSNRYFRPESARAAVSPTTPLAYDADGRLVLRIDDRRLQVVQDRLTLARAIDEESDVSIRSIVVGGGRISATALEAVVWIGGPEDPVDLTVSGRVRTGSMSFGSGTGVLSVDDGEVSVGARIGMLSDVRASGANGGDLLSFDGRTWGPLPLSRLAESLKGPDPLTEDDVRRIHGSLTHDIPSLIIGGGDAADGSIAINVGTAKNALDVNGGVAIGPGIAGTVGVGPGNLALSGSIGLGSGESPREALDLGSGRIVGGTASETVPNVLDLSASPDLPVTSISFVGGGSAEVSASDVRAMFRLNTKSAGSVVLSHAPAQGTVLGVPQAGRIALRIGLQDIASITGEGVAIGLDEPRLPLDVSGHMGVSDGSQSPKSWMMFRAAVPEAPPTICFPASSRMQVGTLKSYDRGSVWNATATFEPDGTLIVGRRVIGSTKKIDLRPGANDDLAIGGASVVKVIGDATATIGGLSDGVDGAITVVVNVGTTSVAIANESIGSIKKNRIAVPQKLEILAGRCMTFVYDGDAERWLPSA